MRQSMDDSLVTASSVPSSNADASPAFEIKVAQVVGYCEYWHQMGEGRSAIKSVAQDEETNENVLSLLSFAASETSLELPFSRNFRTMSGTGSSGRRRMQRPSTSMQGVLWKRRDVFRNRWRPRWFVLHPEQGILTYYLLNGNSHPAATTSTEYTTSPVSANRRRADSDISMDTVDYDVVPRGSIFLGDASCMVEVNESLTRPEERLYALTISDRETGVHCHLACRSSTARDRWLVKIQEAITQRQIRTSPRSGLSSAGPSQSVEPVQPIAPTEPPQQQESIDIVTVPVDTTTTATTMSSDAKWATVESSDLTNGIPPSIAVKINSLLETHLPHATESNHPDFKFSYEEGGVKVCNHKSLPILKSIYSVNDHHPAEYLQLVWDFSRASELEPNVRTQEKLRALNKYTSIIHTTYHPVWPTRGRDFCSVAHWRLLQNSGSGETALCLVAFSCPEANKLKPAQENHVRGTLNISLHLWQPIKGGGCTHTRILSFDMKGKIPTQLMQTILQQQATLPPRAMDVRLRAIKSEARDSRTSPLVYRMDYETMIRAAKNSGNHRKATLRHGDSVVVSSSSYSWNGEDIFARPQNVSLLTESLVLLLPLALRPILALTGRPRLEVAVLCVLMVSCIRWVLMQHLLRSYHVVPHAKRQRLSRNLTGATTLCRVALDIKISLGFLANERFAKVALGEEDLAPLEFHHVLLRSISKAMQKHPSLVMRSFPFLPPLYNLDMRWYSCSSKTKSIWIPATEQYSIQAIANCCGSNDVVTSQFDRWPRSTFGLACQIWTHSDQGPGPAPETGKVFSHVADGSDRCPISVAVYPAAIRSGEKKENGEHRDDYSDDSSGLELIISFHSRDVETCRSFVEEILMSIQFPELCDS